MDRKLSSVALAGVEGAGLAARARFEASARDDATIPIPKWLMVLAARGEVTLRVPVDLEEDPIGELDESTSDE